MLTWHGKLRDLSALLRLPAKTLAAQQAIDPQEADVWMVLRDHPTLETVNYRNKDYPVAEFLDAVADGTLFQPPPAPPTPPAPPAPDPAPVPEAYIDVF